jgi:hypothetical protein
MSLFLARMSKKSNINPLLQNRKLVFVGGLHKSGTSLLFRCLREHPQITGFVDTGVPEDEGQHLQSVYPPAIEHGGPGQFGFDAASYLDEKSLLVSLDNAKRIFAEWEEYWESGKLFLLEKSPPNLIRTRFLQALFPHSYFIMLVRHPIVVSLATQKWSKTSMRSLIEHWLICHERLYLDSAHLTNLLVLKYEAFVKEPQTVFNEICSFLGADRTRVGREVRSNVNDKYFVMWNRIQQRTLARFFAKYMVLRFEKRVKRFGYSLKDSEYFDPDWIVDAI